MMKFWVVNGIRYPSNPKRLKIKSSTYKVGVKLQNVNYLAEIKDRIEASYLIR